jgi:hypothetical protein
MPVRMREVSVIIRILVLKVGLMSEPGLSNHRPGGVVTVHPFPQDGECRWTKKKKESSSD